MSIIHKNINTPHSGELEAVVKSLKPLQSLSNLNVLNRAWYIQPEFLGSIISSSIALIIALGIIQKLTGWLDRPRLIVKNFVLTPQSAILSLGRIKFKNEGKSLAKGVEATVEVIVDNGIERENFIPVPLGWTHSGAFLTPGARRDIYPKQSVYLDLFEYYPSNTPPLLRLKVEAGGEIPNFTHINQGVTKVYIRLNEKKGVTIKIAATLTWETNDEPSVKLKYINHKG